MRNPPIKPTGPKQRTLNDGTVYLTLNEKQQEAVNELLATGFWGSTPAEAVRRVFDQFVLGRRPTVCERPV